MWGVENWELGMFALGMFALAPSLTQIVSNIEFDSFPAQFGTDRRTGVSPVPLSTRFLRQALRPSYGKSCPTGSPIFLAIWHKPPGWIGSIRLWWLIVLVGLPSAKQLIGSISLLQPVARKGEGLCSRASRLGGGAYAYRRQAAGYKFEMLPN